MQQPWPNGPAVVSRPPAWLWVMPVISCGLLAFVPPIVVAAKLKSSRPWWWAGGVTIAWFLGVVLMTSQPEDVDNVWTNGGALLYLGAWVGGIVYSLVMGPKVNWSPQAVIMTTPTYDPNSAAIAEVQGRRRKRDEARELVRRDPLMARDLRIGRPDLPRHYDDGGLIDVNSAPEQVMVQWLGLSPAQAAQVVEVRQGLQRFEHVEDLVNLAGLEQVTYDQVRDRVVLM